MTKRQRQEVYNKFGGLCAYSGKPLGDDWQVDHITPKPYFLWSGSDKNPDHIDNLLPCLKKLNHYKRCKNLEEWREFLKRLHIRLGKLPMKTRVRRTESRKQYLLAVAEVLGITPERPFDGVFYFETLTPTP